MVIASTSEIQHLAEIIKGIRIAMMTTVGSGGSLRSRPMATLDTDFDGTLWFFTRVDSEKVGEVDDEGQVNLTYADPGQQCYASLSGRATLCQDKQKIEELWTDDADAWFQNGLNDPQLALLRVSIGNWEYWDARSGVMIVVDGSLIEQTPEFIEEFGDHLRIDISGIWLSQDVGNTHTRNDYV